MDAGIISCMVKWAAQKLSSLIPAVGSSSDRHGRDLEDLRSLERTMQWIQAKLEDAEERDIRDHSEKLHLEELKEVAYDAEDAVDEYGYEVLRAKAEALKPSSSSSSSGHKRKLDEVREPIADDHIHAPTVPVPNDLATEVKEITKRFDEITKSWHDLRWREGDGARRRDHRPRKQQPTTCYVHKPEVHGRECDKENVIKLLLEDGELCSAHTLSVVPIIGMGGIGKTTLAQLVYNDPRVDKYFGARGWVCVSVDFETFGLTRKIHESITKRQCEYTELNEIVSDLKEVLKGKRFLLVLDDVWNEKPMLWDDLNHILLSVGFGKVIVTARNESTAQIMQTVLPYRLGHLPYDHCWSIFCQQAFEGRDCNAHPELVRVGREIVEKCKGLPLAVKAIGGILRFEADEDKWIDILENEIWGSEDEVDPEDVVLPALRLSYERMPPVLKQCFKFLSLFPKDFVFEKDDMVRMWMSQGFVRFEEGKLPEDVGTEYFEDLLQRSLLQEGPNSDFEEGNFVMHDLIHDLAQFVAGKEYLRIEGDVPENLYEGVRHLSLFWRYDHSPTIILQRLQNLRALRTFILYDDEHIDAGKLNDLFQNMKRIRTLILRGVSEILFESMCNSKLLRYFKIMRTLLKMSPENHVGLYNLQTFDFEDGDFENLNDLLELKGINELTNLRHLLGRIRVCLPSSLRYLTNLQTLSAVHVQERENCAHFRIRDLKNLDHLRGKLHISNLLRITSGKDARDANLKRKEHVKHLILQGSSVRPPLNTLHCERDFESSKDDMFDEQVLENLQPHTNITMLEIEIYDSTRFPGWVGDDSYSKLVHVTIYYSSFTSLPSLGQLPSLRELRIHGIQRLEYVGREFRGAGVAVKGFPSLKVLEFFDMYDWMEWGGCEDGDFPCLQELDIHNCQHLERLPQNLSPSLSKLRISRCRKLDKLPLLPALTHLLLEHTVNEMIFSSLHLPSLHTLEINSVEDGSLSADYRNLHSLKKLDISYCHNLRTVVSLPDLTSLEELTVIDSPKIEFRLPRAIEMGNSPSLQEYCRSADVKLTVVEARR